MPVRTRRWRRRFESARAIQRAWRLRRAVDPITLDRVTGPVFRHVDADSGFTTIHSAGALARCFAASGDFRNPLSRKELNRAELLRLQNLARKSGVSVDLVATMRERRAEREARLDEEALLAFLVDDVRQAGADLVYTVSDPDLDVADAIDVLQSGLFATFRTAVANLRTVDPPQASDAGRAVLRDLQRVQSIAGRIARSFVTLTLYRMDTDHYEHHAYRVLHVGPTRNRTEEPRSAAQSPPPLPPPPPPPPPAGGFEMFLANLFTREAPG